MLVHPESGRSRENPTDRDGPPNSSATLFSHQGDAVGGVENARHSGHSLTPTQGMTLRKLCKAEPDPTAVL